MGVITWDQAVDIGGGRGRLAPAPAASLARVDRGLRSAFGRAADINEAWRSPEDADRNYAKYLAYLRDPRNNPWAPIALPGDKSVHCFGYAVDTDDTSAAQMRIWNDHGWRWTVYRNGELVERWHLEYFAHLDNHRNDPAPAGVGNATTTPVQEDDMYDDKAKEDAANRHTEALREISYLRPIKLYALVNESGAGGWVWVGPSGRFWAVPNGAYVALVEAQKLSQASPIRALQKDEFKFLTEQLLGGLVPDGKNEYNPEAQLDKILSLDQGTVDRLVEGIKAAPVALTQVQLDAIASAAARGAAAGGEEGARKALQDLTFVVTAS